MKALLIKKNKTRLREIVSNRDPSLGYIETKRVNSKHVRYKNEEKKRKKGYERKKS